MSLTDVAVALPLPEVVVDGTDLVCPNKKCGAHNEIVEIDQALRENTLMVDEDGVVFAGTGDFTFHRLRFECSACGTEVLPLEIAGYS